MWRKYIVLFFILFAVSLSAQTKEDIEYALNEIAKPLGGIVNDAVLEDANTLGGLPHFNVTAGINLRSVTFKDPDDPENNEEWTAGAISFEGRVGLFKGKSIAPTIGGVGSADLLFRLAFYPMGNDDSTSFVPLVGIGLKLGVIRESLTTPAISITAQYTGSSKFELSDSSGTYAEFTMKVLSFRTDVSKNLFIVTPYAGVGFNINSMNAHICYHDPCYMPCYESYAVSPSATRLYLGLHKQIFVLGLNVEGGLSGDKFYWAVGVSAGM